MYVSTSQLVHTVWAMAPQSVWAQDSWSAAWTHKIQYTSNEALLCTHSHTQYNRKSAHKSCALFVLLSFLHSNGEKTEEKSIKFIRFVSARIYPLCMVRVCLSLVCPCSPVSLLCESVHSMRSIMRNRPASQPAYIQHTARPKLLLMRPLSLSLDGGLCSARLVAIFVLAEVESPSDTAANAKKKHKNHFTINYVCLPIVAKYPCMPTANNIRWPRPRPQMYSLQMEKAALSQAYAERALTALMYSYLFIGNLLHEMVLATFDENARSNNK